MVFQKIINKVFLYHGSCNSYYIDDEVKILIDAGVDLDKKIDVLVLTHFHPDHALFARRIKDRTNCRILIGHRDLEPLKLLTKVWPTWEGKKIGEVVPDGLLKEGDVINTGSMILKVLEVPGHTIGSIAFFEPVKKILFTGDTLFAHGVTGRIDFPYSDSQSMDESVERLKSLKADIILPEHGEIIRV